MRNDSERNAVAGRAIHGYNDRSRRGSSRDSRRNAGIAPTCNRRCGPIELDGARSLRRTEGRPSDGHRLTDKPTGRIERGNRWRGVRNRDGGVRVRLDVQFTEEIVVPALPESHALTVTKKRSDVVMTMALDVVHENV